MRWQSEQIDQVSSAILEATKEMPNVVGDKEMVVRGGRKAKYATLGHWISSMKPHLEKFGLIVVSGHERTGVGDSLAYVTRVIHAQSGQWIASPIDLLSADNDKDHWGNITSARRYAFKALFNITESDEDDSAARPTTIDKPRPQRTNPTEDPGQRLSRAVQACRNILGGDWTEKKVVDELLPEPKAVKNITHGDMDEIGKELMRRKAEMETAQ